MWNFHEYAGLWKHSMDVRHGIEGKLRTHLGAIAALATGRVTVSAMRKGMRMGSRLAEALVFQ